MLCIRCLFSRGCCQIPHPLAPKSGSRKLVSTQCLLASPFSRQTAGTKRWLQRAYSRSKNRLMRRLLLGYHRYALQPHLCLRLSFNAVDAVHATAPLQAIEAVLRAWPQAAKLATSDGKTPLHCAMENKASPEVVQILIDTWPGVRLSRSHSFSLSPLCECVVCVFISYSSSPSLSLPRSLFISFSAL